MLPFGQRFERSRLVCQHEMSSPVSALVAGGQWQVSWPWTVVISPWSPPVGRPSSRIRMLPVD